MKRFFAILLTYSMLTGAAASGEHMIYGLGFTSCRTLTKTMLQTGMGKVAVIFYIQGFVTAMNGAISLNKTTMADISYGVSAETLLLGVNQYCRENPGKDGEDAILAALDTAREITGN